MGGIQLGNGPVGPCCCRVPCGAPVGHAQHSHGPWTRTGRCGLTRRYARPMSASDDASDCLFCQHRRPGHPGRRSCTRAEHSLAFRDIAPPGAHPRAGRAHAPRPDLPVLADGLPRRAGRCDQGDRATSPPSRGSSRRLPPRRQHRRGRPAERLPRPPARPRWPLHDVAARLSADLVCQRSVQPRTVAR